MELDITGSAFESAEQLVHVVDEIQHMPIRQDLPPDGLAIGPYRKKKPLAVRLLEITKRPKDAIHKIDQGNSRQIYNQLSIANDRTYDELRTVGIVILGYFLHNFCAEEREIILRFIKKQCPDSILIAADYTLKGVPPDISQTLLTGEFEQHIMKQKGTERFIAEHSGFTLGDLGECATDAGWNHVSTAPLRAGRGVMIAANRDIFRETLSLRERMGIALNTRIDVDYTITAGETNFSNAYQNHQMRNKFQTSPIQTP